MRKIGIALPVGRYSALFFAGGISALMACTSVLGMAG